MSAWQRVVRFVEVDLWNAPAAARKGAEWGRRLLQYAVLVVQGFSEDLILLRASALTYYAVLALVPVLAIALLVVDAMGIGEDIMPRIVGIVAAGSPDAAQYIVDMVEGVNFRALGTIGAVTLFATTILGISSIERSLNAIWGVASARSWERRLPDYLAIVIVLPLLVGVAISLGTTLRSDAIVVRLYQIPGFQTAFDLGLSQAPLIFLSLGFSFMYWFMPNTRVRFVSALIGGVTAAVLFTTVQSLYVDFQVGMSRANAVYGGLAVLPLLLVWIYVSWVIVLVGAEVAYAHQAFQTLRIARRADEMTAARRESIGLALVTRLADAFRRGEGPVGLEALSEAFELPERRVREILSDLGRVGIVTPSGDSREARVQLGRAAERVPIIEVIEALRGGSREEVRPEPAAGRVGAVLAEIDRETHKALADRTIADLIDDDA